MPDADEFAADSDVAGMRVDMFVDLSDGRALGVEPGGFRTGSCVGQTWLHKGPVADLTAIRISNRADAVCEIVPYETFDSRSSAH